MTSAISASESTIPPTVRALDHRIGRVLDEFTHSLVWRLIANPDTSTHLIEAVIREVYWEVWSYQPLTTKAGFLMIGGIDLEEHRVMRTLLLHKWEEAEHRVWALDGYKAFAGDLSRIENPRESFSQASFAMAAVWERIAQHLPPLAYLGAEYLFEELTAKIAPMVVAALSGRSLPAAGMRFIVDHATEDEKHSYLLRSLIEDVVQRKPELHASILYAFDCFNHVYPMPVWMTAFDRAMSGTP